MECRYCSIQTVFPVLKDEPKTQSTIKLTEKKVMGIIHQKEKRESSGIIEKIQHITHRRVNQLWKQNRDTGTIPVREEKTGQPEKPITAEESTTITITLSCLLKKLPREIV